MITLNGTTIISPQNLNEYTDEVQSDSVAIDGSRQRDWISSKKAADLKWTSLLPTDYATIINIVKGQNAVAYINDDSAGGTWSFTGLVTFSEGEYLKGASHLRSLSITLKEV